MALIRCNVESVCGGNAWEVTFPGHPGKSLFLQTDWDRHAFAAACGKADGDKNPSNDRRFIDLDPSDIDQCPDDYLDAAQESEDEPDDADPDAGRDPMELDEETRRTAGMSTPEESDGPPIVGGA